MLDPFYTSLFSKPDDKAAHLILADYLEVECGKKDLADTHRYFVGNCLYPKLDVSRLVFYRKPSRDKDKHTITDTLLFALLKKGKPNSLLDSIVFSNFRALAVAFTTALKHYKEATNSTACFQVSKSMWVKGERVMIRTVAPYGMDRVDYYVMLPSYHDVLEYRPPQRAPKHLIPQIVSDFARN